MSAHKTANHWSEQTSHSTYKGTSKSGKDRPAFIILGAPDDRAVMNVGGRVGASDGPQFIRQIFSTMTLGIQDELTRAEIYKGSDVSLGESIVSSHDEMSKLVCESLKNGLVPIVIGGGHDYGFPHIKGTYDFLKEAPLVINIDAHLDLRPLEGGKITSGSPFFLALESGTLQGKDLIEFGIQSHCNQADRFKYAKKNKVKIHMLSETRKGKGALYNFEQILKNAKKSKKKVVVSFDLDAMAMAYSPGVSAPQADGFTSQEFLEFAEKCGAYFETVLSIGIFECAPRYDAELKSARIAATAIHRFISARVSSG